MNQMLALPDRVRLQLVMSPDGCWLWQGHTIKGYGSFRLRARQTYVHRFTYEHLVDVIPAGYEIDHLCRVKNCANPEHLEPVTPDENKRRCRVEYCTKGHSMADAYITRPTDGGRETRRCRPCTRDYQQGRRVRRPIVLAPCATTAGYNRHLRAAEKPCADCASAKREYDQLRRDRLRAAKQDAS